MQLINILGFVERSRFLGEMKVVGYTSGVFDLLHHGHISYLKKCSTLCDVLVVGVDADSMVKRRKGSLRPVQTSAVRVGNVVNSGFFAFEKNCSSLEYAFIIRPNIHFFPSDKRIDELKVGFLKKISNFREVKIVPFTPGVSTTKLINDSMVASGFPN